MAIPLIRAATVGDAGACAAIYAPYVRDTVITFEESPPNTAAMAARITERGRTHGWLVATTDDRVLGFAYAGVYREREAWQWVCETTIYLDPAAAGRGIGRRLYAALFDVLADRGYRVAIASIALPNPASIALHEAVGFTQFGVSPAVGFKLGSWVDVAWLQRPLGDGAATAPEPLRTPLTPPGCGGN